MEKLTFWVHGRENHAKSFLVHRSVAFEHNFSELVLNDHCFRKRITAKRVYMVRSRVLYFQVVVFALSLVFHRKIDEFKFDVLKRESSFLANPVAWENRFYTFHVSGWTKRIPLVCQWF